MTDYMAREHPEAEASQVGWVPVDQMPDEWKDGRPLLVAFDMTQCVGDEVEIARYERDDEMPGGYAWYSSTGDSAWPIDIDPILCRPVPTPDTPDPREGIITRLVEALERIRDEANTVGGDWRETASLIDSICLSALLAGGE